MKYSDFASGKGWCFAIRDYQGGFTVALPACATPMEAAAEFHLHDELDCSSIHGGPKKEEMLPYDFILPYILPY